MKKRSMILRCFTPLVSLGTFVIEWSLAAYVWENYRKTTFGKLTIVFFLILGYFQFAEFAICRLGNDIFWARSAVGAAAFLPPIFLYLIYLLGHGNKKTLTASFATAALFFAYFALTPDSIARTQCLGRYVAFHGAQNYLITYALWYWLMVITVFVNLIRGLQKHTKHHAATFWMFIATIVLVVPTQLAFWIFPYTRIGHLSIFCGFAIFTALIMVFKVLPQYHKNN